MCDDVVPFPFIFTFTLTFPFVDVVLSGAPGVFRVGNANCAPDSERTLLLLLLFPFVFVFVFVLLFVPFSFAGNFGKFN